MLNQINIEYPRNLPDILQITKKDFEKEARMAMAVKLFEMKRLSSGMAATLAGLDRVNFLLNLHRFNIPMIDSYSLHLYFPTSQPQSRTGGILMSKLPY